MSDFDKNDPVWDLLGKAKPSEASPWFADRVMNNLPDPEVGRREARGGFFSRLLGWAPGGVFALLLGVGIFAAHQDAASPVLFSSNGSVEFEIIQNLDLYVSVADQQVWLQ